MVLGLSFNHIDWNLKIENQLWESLEVLKEQGKSSLVEMS